MTRIPVRDLVARRLVPRAVVLASRVDRPARVAAAVRRARGGRGRVELFFAFDDPCSAVAVLDLEGRVAGRDVDLVLLPVAERGMAGDPAIEAKRRHAIADARRLGARAGLTLSRDAPVAPADVAFLAGWAATLPSGPERTRWCAAALRELWFASDGAVGREAYAALWRRELGTEPPPGDDAAVAGNARRMRRRGPYDTPAAWVAGQWFFAHDRPAQVAARLDDLGWTTAS